jgi:hypothetical protein
MNKIKKYYPNYQLKDEGSTSNNVIRFKHGNVYYEVKESLFGATKNQKALLKNVYGVPPVMYVECGSPTKPDVDSLPSRELCVHRHIVSMVHGTIHCLGEDNPRKVKVYFCNEHTKENNPTAPVDAWSKTVIVKLAD